MTWRGWLLVAVIATMGLATSAYYVLAPAPAVSAGRTGGTPPTVTPRLSSPPARPFVMVRSMVADGIGVTILSDMVYRPWSLEGQRIELRSIVADIPTMDVGLAWSRKRAPSDATKTLHEFFSLSFGGASG